MDSTVENQKSEEKSLTVRQLYPTLSEKELVEAETNLLRYFELALDVYEDQTSHPVDTFSPLPTMKERSKETLKT
jgi:hypothetical protein